MAISEKQNLGMMNLIRKVHGLVERPDLNRHRQSQDRIGALLGTEKSASYTPVTVEGMECEWVRPARARRRRQVILYCHGGGYSTGSAVYARTLTTRLAEGTGMDVLCFNYRLAPEHPYPAAAEDAVKAWDYLMQIGYGARDVFVAGDSAGGNLALVLTLLLKERERFLPAALVLLSPWTDLTGSGKSYESKKELDPVLDRAYLDRMIGNYADKQTLSDPCISPLFGDFCGFPPTYIQAGSNEILLSDAELLYKRLKKENVPVRIDVYKGMWHVFQMSPLKVSAEALEKCAQFILDI
ncbi:MAG: alpha/beta hydrolase [Eubacteriales bacterium]|nr:alpha/beta hydrolase [Eubacteriales bacterium]